ncbi:nep1-interacting protein 2 [Phtheirospermum japonicum]|uniref:Nep1-interacting protein 2 n=1 Tax=Phtheirospermum japonicum TaxID=374723 RepID=A0A830CUX9_9LAMI|nr:nep1-interacting protein 2 [Phtheirospermum japonicum]
MISSQPAGLLNKFAVALLTCTFALGGAAIGSITGALKGHTTETGLLRGIGVGAVAGAITAVQLMDLIATGEPFSKVALICSLLNGKIFMEWVSPAMLKAYQWQVSTTETSLSEISDIFDVMNTMSPGLSHDAIKELPVCEFYNNAERSTCDETSCAICLQDLKNGESIRLLPNCKHLFHLHCIDTWLTRQGSCPICRQNV